LIGALGGGLIATFIAAGLVGSAAPASAQDGFGNVFGYQSQQRYKRRGVQRNRGPSSDDQAADKSSDKKDKKGKKEEAKQSAPTGAVYAVISLADQHITVYDATGRIAQSRISTGMPGHPTPIGLFSIIGKERWHHSNIYSGAPMPFMQRITWSGVAMHTGVVPGYPASHGCIRLPGSFAQQLWGMTQLGNRVVVARRDTAPFEVSSAFLPMPKMQPAPDVLPGSRQAAAPPSAPVKVASIGDAAAVAVSATTPPQDSGTPATTAPKLLNPIEYAKALKERALAGKTAADQAAKNALAAAQAVAAEARQAVDDVSKADADLKTAETKLAALDAQVSAAGAAAAQRPVTPPVTTQAVATQPTTTAPAAAPDAAMEATAAAAVAAAASARAAAQGDIDRARAALTEAQGREAAKTPAAFTAVQAWKNAVAISELAAETVKEADRRLEPVSILFSKKEGRVFIRQDWKEVFEAPITFKDPDRLIGTHLFIAVNGDADGKMKWSVISVPSGATPSDDPPRRRSKTDKKDEPAAAPSPPQGDTAAAALERVEMPNGLRERMAELVWNGAQVIVTDNARSDEMDIDTDIIVSTR
jgi:lipoprotein-anchoring transpeptidase ErfK/SrfK